MSEHLFAEANQSASSDPLIALVTITHPLLAEPYRAALNGEAIVSRGNAYRPAGAVFVPPEHSQDGFKPGRLRIFDVGFELLAALRSAAGTAPPKATFELIYASAPDNVERQWPSLVFQSARYDDAIEAALSFPNLSTEPWPRYRFVPATHPGLVF